MKAVPDCIFCKIASGQLPCEKILEDEYSLAFMDIGPVVLGHTLLVPRQHGETIEDLPEDTAAGMLKNLPRLVRAVRLGTGCEGVNVLQNNGRIAGQVVPHVHFHIIPRDKGSEFQFNWPAGRYEEGQMQEIAGNIRDNL